MTKVIPVLTVVAGAATLVAGCKELEPVAFERTEIPSPSGDQTTLIIEPSFRAQYGNSGTDELVRHIGTYINKFGCNKDKITILPTLTTPNITPDGMIAIPHSEVMKKLPKTKVREDQVAISIAMSQMALACSEQITGPKQTIFSTPEYLMKSGGKGLIYQVENIKTGETYIDPFLQDALGRALAMIIMEKDKNAVFVELGHTNTFPALFLKAVLEDNGDHSVEAAQLAHSGDIKGFLAFLANKNESEFTERDLSIILWSMQKAAQTNNFSELQQIISDFIEYRHRKTAENLNLGPERYLITQLTERISEQNITKLQQSSLAVEVSKDGTPLAWYSLEHQQKMTNAQIELIQTELQLAQAKKARRDAQEAIQKGSYSKNKAQDDKSRARNKEQILRNRIKLLKATLA